MVSRDSKVTKSNRRGELISVMEARFVVGVMIRIATAFAVPTVPQTSITEFTFLSNPLSWNDAAIVCEANGGKLANVESEVKEASMVSSVNHLISRSLLNSKLLWIGLHRDDGITSDYVWSDCANLTSWQAWNETNIQNTTDHMCVSLDTDVKWHPTNCSERLPALCESYRPCGCDMGAGTACADMSKTQSTTVTVSSVGTCLTQCMYHVNGGDECWAITYLTNNGTCFLHERLTYSTICLPDSVFYTKNCFTLTFPGTDFVNPVNVPDVSSFPKNNCSGNVSVDVTPIPCQYDYDTLTSPILSVTVHTTSSVSVSTTASPSSARCVCYKEKNTTLGDRLEWLKAETRVDKRTTSQHKRRKSSATDYRLSACGIGAAGIVILILVVGGIILLDFGRLRLDFSRGGKNVAFCVSKTKRYIESRQNIQQ